MVRIFDGKLQEDSGGKIKTTFESFIEKDFYIALVLVFFAVFFSIVILMFLPSETKFEKTCGDGTFYDTCSLRKPYFCSDGILGEKASVCRCPENLRAEGDFCISPFYNESKDVTLKYILRGQEDEFNFTVYQGIYDYVLKIPDTINYFGAEAPSEELLFEFHHLYL